MQQLDLLKTGTDNALISMVVSPKLELGAYEVLWAKQGATFKTIADIFRKHPNSLPSDFVERSEAEGMGQKVFEMLNSAKIKSFGVRIHHAGEYPEKLRQAMHPVELLYYQGWWNLVETPSVAIVGSRKPSEAGIKRTVKLVKHLVKDNFTIVSGLAQGIDTTAHRTAIEEGGLTIAVIGTPISEVYPKENYDLQKLISSKYLLISQVPVFRYSQQIYTHNRLFFPERNKTMSALTAATIIVEASDTSGTLIQAQAALYQKRKLFILDSCFKRTDITWPARFEKLGAIRVSDYEDIKKHLKNDFVYSH